MAVKGGFDAVSCLVAPWQACRAGRSRSLQRNDRMGPILSATHDDCGSDRRYEWPCNRWPLLPAKRVSFLYVGCSRHKSFKAWLPPSPSSPRCKSPADDSWPEVQRLVQATLGTRVLIQCRRRADFYAQAEPDDTALVIVTADARRFADVLLTVGPVNPPTET